MPIPETRNVKNTLISQGPAELVDAVYTWVNDSDPTFVQELSLWKQRTGANSAVSGPERFRDWNTLMFSLRSLEVYANWIRHVFIVTNGQIPHWLNTSHPRVSVVTHEEIFTNKSHLPTFSSCAIETHIHRIPGLSKRFLYLNDDTFFGKPVTLEDFYSEENGTVLRFIKVRVRDCSSKCKIAMINNKICDEECNIQQCEWDGKDCGHLEAFDDMGNVPNKSLRTYLGSIFHTAVLYNAAFGYVQRTIPAHVPHFIDRDIMADLQMRFPREWDRTSSQRFRSSTTLQYAFAYYQFLMERNGNVQERYTLSRGNIMYQTIGSPDKLAKTLEYKLKTDSIPKFCCLNDKAKFNSEEEKLKIQDVLMTFFLKLFPKPSAFEKLIK